jgi:2,4-diketo-3-deoxy-L-fuconate hydrolase
MRFFRYGPLGSERPAVDHDGTSYDLTPLTHDIDPAFIAADGLRAASDAVLAGQLPPVVVDGQRLGAPIVRPAAVICIGQNYAAHAAESGSPVPTTPIVFLKHPGCIVGAHDDVVIPVGSTKTDWEVELAVVIGNGAEYLASPDAARDCIAGYTISNDVSERAFQIELSGGQWSKGKCAPTFNPLGPYLVPTADVPDPQALRLQSWVNEEPRQDSSTSDMIFDVAYLVWHLSQHMLLCPGDIINTGTPEGVGLSGRFPYLGPGDTMRLEVTGLGSQQQRLVAARGDH